MMGPGGLLRGEEKAGGGLTPRRCPARAGKGLRAEAALPMSPAAGMHRRAVEPDPDR